MLISQRKRKGATLKKKPVTHEGYNYIYGADKCLIPALEQEVLCTNTLRCGSGLPELPSSSQANPLVVSFILQFRNKAILLCPSLVIFPDIPNS